MSSMQTAVFRRVVGDRMAPPPLVVTPGTSAAETVRGMAAAAASAVVAVDGTGAIRGILTEQDVVRRVACRGDGELPVERVMTAPVLTIDRDDHLYAAIGFMRRHRLRHMPVVDAAGRLVGMLHLHDALAVAAGTLVEDIDRLTHEDTFEGLAQVKAAQVELARNLLRDGVPAPEILALVADINNDIHRRVLRLVLAELAAEGRGAPPVAFEAIVMGSGGRGESGLFPDQDNGFVLADYPDAVHEPVDSWLAEAAVRMVQRLDALGLRLCKGGVMASNPLWRKTLSQWREQLTLWVRRKHPVMLLAADIFLDFRVVFRSEGPERSGEPAASGGLGAELRAFATDLVRRSPHFLREILGIHADHRAGIGLFGRLVTERDDPAHRGHINLKLHGTLPLAEAVRLLALTAGVSETGTLARIAALRTAGRATADEADRLSAAFAFVTFLQLRQQIADYGEARPVSSFVDPATLTERERATLKDCLRAVNEFRTRVAAELTGRLV